MAKNKDSDYSVKMPKLQVTKKTYDFSLSLPGMITAVGAGVLALTFFFVMGILIGRGYRPEADVPQLSELMPDKQHGQVGEAPLKNEILKPEELDYPERLKESPKQVMANAAAEAKAEADANKPKAPAKLKAESKAETAPAPAPAPTAQPGEATFDYIYQVASFRKLDMAESLAAKLSGAGLRTNINSGEANGSTWHRVRVLHRGTPASTADMKATLTRFGLGKPLLKKKTPAS
ncbi:SPOR domain-containing protein [Pseudodesulfovibrio cashew]|uniref:SPOR domain-containing protein n=1 Tax=Pseudodesulfovibrio cashew TaxID=2678688 RepID=A0A6I6JAV7_9BACT|nr:SPOR domain-containing protein [Pseudodesulfovibrio cashew]QGY39906.1 SPOR domain-containing protein [Pseudodesulfovibrio cashew]